MSKINYKKLVDDLYDKKQNKDKNVEDSTSVERTGGLSTDYKSMVDRLYDQKINPGKNNTERYYDSLNVKKNETLADYAADIVSRPGSTKKEADYTKDLKAQYNAKKLDDAYENWSYLENEDWYNDAVNGVVDGKRVKKLGYESKYDPNNDTDIGRYAKPKVADWKEVMNTSPEGLEEYKYIHLSDKQKKKFSEIENRKGKYEFIDENEYNTFLALLNHEGADKAEEFIDDMDITWSKRSADLQTERIREKLDDHPVLETVGSVAAAVVKPIAGAIGLVGDAVEGLTGNYDPYSANNKPSLYLEALQDATRKDIEESSDTEIAGVNVGGFLYDTGMSTITSMANVYTLGKMLTPFMGMDAAESRARELTEQGAEDWQVTLGAGLSGVAEAAFEYLSIDRLLKTKSTDSWKTIFTNVMKQSFTEGSEEVATEIANTLSDYMVRGGQSDFMQTYKQYLKNGLSEDEALKEAGKDVAKQISLAGIGGALSGGLSGAVYSGANYNANIHNGEAIRKNNQTGALLEDAAKMDEKTNTGRYLGKLGNISSDEMTDAQIGALEQNYYQDQYDSAYDQYLLEGNSKAESRAFADKASNEAVRKYGLTSDQENIYNYVENVRTNNPEILKEEEKTEEFIDIAKSVEPSMQKAFMDNYKGNDIDEYTKGFKLVETYADSYLSKDYAIQQFKGSTILNEEQVSNIFDSAVKMRNEKEIVKISEQAKKISSEVQLGTVMTGDFEVSGQKFKGATLKEIKSKSKRNAVVAVSSIYNGLGANVQWFNSTKEQISSNVANGWYDGNNNTVYIDVNAGITETNMKDTIVSVASHEITHWMEPKAQSEYRELATAVLNVLGSNENYMNHMKERFGMEDMKIEDVIQSWTNMMSISGEKVDATVNDAVREIVARACEDMLSESEFVNEITSKLSEETKGKIRRHIDTFVRNIKKFIDDVLKSYKSDSEEAKALREMKNEYDNIKKLWDNALRKAVDVNKDLYNTENSQQRENTDTEYVRFSTRTDSEGNKLTEGQMEYFKDSKIVDKNGNLKVMYHGSPEFFTVFDRKKAKSSGTYGKGFYFTDSDSHAGQYGSRYKVYLNITNPLSGDTKNITKNQLTNFVQELAENEDYGIENYGYGSTVESVVDSVWGKTDLGMIIDLDATCIGNTVEAVELFNEVNGTDYDGIVAKTETVAFYPDQIKLTTNQNPTDDADIRYSSRRSENKSASIFKDAIEDAKNDDDFGYARKFIIDDDGKEIAVLERKLFSNRKIKDNGKAVANTIEIILNTLNGKNVKIDSTQMNVTFDKVFSHEYAHSKDSVNSSDKSKIVKYNGARVVLDMIKKAIPFSEKEGFHVPNRDLKKGPGTQRDASKGFYYYHTYVALEDEEEGKYQIYHGKMSVRADQNDKKHVYEISGIKEIGYPSQKNVKNGTPYSSNTLSKETKLVNREEKAIQNSIRKSDEELLKENKRLRASAQKMKEQTEKKANIEQIVKISDSIMKSISENTAKKHVIDELKIPIYNIMKAIDFSSNRYIIGEEPTVKEINIAQALEDMANAITDYKRSLSENDIAAYIDMPQGFEDDIRGILKSVRLISKHVEENGAKFKLNDLSVEELENVKSMVRVLRSFINNTNEALSMRQREQISKISKESIRDLREIGYYRKSKSKIAEDARKFLSWDNTNPWSAFQRFGEGGKKVFESLMDGFDKYAFLVDEIIDYTDSIYSKDEVKKWEKEVKQFDVAELLPEEDVEEGIQPRVIPVKLTVANIMELYELSKREQAVGHIIGAGVQIDNDVNTGEQLVLNLTKDNVKTITDTLTERQKEVADKLQKYMNEKGSTLGNEVTYKRFGIRGFTEQNYYPIRTSDIQLNKDIRDDMSSIYRLLNMSFTKKTIKHANNAIVVGSIFDTYAKHMSEMAQYNALALPVLDAVKWYNYSEKRKTSDTQYKVESVKQSMKEAYGDSAGKYFMNFIADLNGNNTGGRGEEYSKKMMSNYKMAAVGANIKVALLQPTAYVRAFNVLHVSSLSKGLTHVTHMKKNMQEVHDGSGIATWKDLGFYDLNVSKGVQSKIKNDDTVLDKIKEKSMIGAEYGDKITWGLLWKACEYEVGDYGKIRKGTEEFDKAVSDKFREVVYRTQVVDSVMTRTEMMRSKSATSQMVTSFMSEQMVTYNMLKYEFESWSDDARKKEGYGKCLRNHLKPFSRAMISFTTTALAAAIATATASTIRRKRDEDETFWQEVYENFVSDIWIVNMIPYVRDIKSIKDGFDPDRMDMQFLVSITSAMKEWDKLMTGENTTFYKAVRKTLVAASHTTGLPIDNAMKEADALVKDVIEMWNLVMEEVYPSLVIKEK